MTKVPEQVEIGWVPAAPGSETSAATATEKKKRGTAARDRNRVLRRLVRQPSTDEEIGTALGMAGNTVRPRRGELVKRRWVQDSGARKLTSSGCPATVWSVTASGVAALKELG